MADIESPLTPTMRGWIRSTRGDYRSVLKLVDTLPTPALPRPESSDVLIRVTHVPLEPSIARLLSVIPVIPFTPAFVPEIVFAGTLVAAGGKASEEFLHQKAGTRVLGWVSVGDMLLHGAGVLKEYVRVPSDQVLRLPGAGEGAHPITLPQATALTGPGQTSLAIVRAGGIKPGHKVLINGASGSVGQLAIQICLDKGATVVGVASGKNESVVKGFGASEFIDYTQHAFLPDHLAATYGAEPFDCILDMVGDQDLYVHSPRYLRPEGVVINIGAMKVGLSLQLWQLFLNTCRPTWLGGVPRKYMFFPNWINKDDVRTLLAMFDQGRLKVQLDSQWEMEVALRGYERSQSHRATGKVIVKVHNDPDDKK